MPPSRGLTVNLLAQIAFGLFAMTVCLPSMAEWGSLFGRPQDQVQLTFSGFVLTYGLLQLVYGPLSDRLGRRAMILAGVAVCSAGSVLAAVALVLSALYVLWAYQRMMTGPVTAGNENVTDLRPRELLVVAPLIALLLVLGVYPKVALDRINPSVEHTLRSINQPDPVPTLTAEGSR